MKKQNLLVPFFTSLVAVFLSGNLLAEEPSSNQMLSANDLVNEDIYIFDFGYGGSGCPLGSLQAKFADTNDKIRLLFEEYSANSGSSTSEARKSCNLGLGVHVPQGLRVSLVSLDYRGRVNVAAGAYASLQAEYFLAGEPTGTSFLREWGDANSAVATRFLEHHEFHTGTIVWSRCGEDVILRANTSIKTAKSAKGKDASIDIKRLDATEEMVYQLQWETCN